jgi:hypothetical protein
MVPRVEERGRDASVEATGLRSLIKQEKLGDPIACLVGQSNHGLAYTCTRKIYRTLIAPAGMSGMNYTVGHVLLSASLHPACIPNYDVTQRRNI